MRVLLTPSFEGVELVVRANTELRMKKENGTTCTGASAPMATIHMVVKGYEEAVRLELDNCETSRDFATLLPLQLKLEDYASTEKISYLPRKLTTHGAPEGYTPCAGDVAYYAPWGNLAIFHKDFTYSVGLIKLGTIISGLDLLRIKGSFTAELE